MKQWPLTNALYCKLRAWKLHRMQISKCIFAVCALTLAFHKVSVRVCGVCMEHIACHLGHFTPLRDALQSICQRSKYDFFRCLWVQYNAPWDPGNSATMSFRNLHVYHGDSYGSHRISIHTAHRRRLPNFQHFPGHRECWGLRGLASCVYRHFLPSPLQRHIFDRVIL